MKNNFRILTLEEAIKTKDKLFPKVGYDARIEKAKYVEIVKRIYGEEMIIAIKGKPNEK